MSTRPCSRPQRPKRSEKPYSPCGLSLVKRPGDPPRRASPSRSSWLLNQTPPPSLKSSLYLKKKTQQRYLFFTPESIQFGCKEPTCPASPHRLCSTLPTIEGEESIVGGRPAADCIAIERTRSVSIESQLSLPSVLQIQKEVRLRFSRSPKPSIPLFACRPDSIRRRFQPI